MKQEKIHQGENAEQLAAHEFDMLNRLKDEACAPIPLERHQATLHLKIPDATPLQTWAPSRSLDDKLRAAISLTESLGKVHAKGIVYRNLSSQHVLISGDFHATWIHFERATRLSRLKQNATQPSQLKGELAYFSPELTGRINRVVDWRSDLYGLGVLLYELFAGHLPFSAETPIEWVNAHLSHHPAPLSSELPANLVQIIMTLLAKNPEQRYASIQGLVHDLGRLAAGEREFPLKERDFSQIFAVPDRLYGRDKEVAALEKFIDQIHDPLQFVAIAAPSGMGKTALVEELKRSMSLKGAILCSGKFDQFAQNQPFSALGQAIDELSRQVMTWETSVYEAWRKRVLKALDGYGKLLTDISPRFERILGEQPKLPDVDVDLAAKRVARTFFGFFSQCASKDCPVIFFIDDLQWLDPSTLAVLEMLKARQKELRHVLMIHAYRSDELKADHPYSDWLKTVDITTISLDPLPETIVSDLLSDGFGGRISDADLATITHLLAGRSAGSPFFLRELIGTLIDQEAIRLDVEAARWWFDQKAASKIEFSGDLAELLLTKLQQAPQDTQQALALMSFVGRSFSLLQLKQCAQLANTHEAAQLLWPAIELDLIAPTDEGFQMLLTSSADNAEASCRFVHDKVQAAARGQILESDLVTFKRDIALRLLADRDPITLDREAILLANLLAEADLEGQDAINRRLLRFQAGILSRQSGQHTAALAFLDKAMKFDGAWLPAHKAHSLMIADEFASALLANTDVKRLEDLLREVTDHIEDKLDSHHVTRELISAYGATGAHKKGTALYKRFISSIDSGLPLEASVLSLLSTYRKAKKLVGDPRTYVANLKVANRKGRIVSTFAQTAGAVLAHSGESLLLATHACYGAILAPKDGIVPNSYIPLASLACIACAFGDYAYSRELADATPAPPPESFTGPYAVLALSVAQMRLLSIDNAWKVPTVDTFADHAHCCEVYFHLGDIQGASESITSATIAPVGRGQSFKFQSEVYRFMQKQHSQYDFSSCAQFMDTLFLMKFTVEASSHESPEYLFSLSSSRTDDQLPVGQGIVQALDLTVRTLLGIRIPSSILQKWRFYEEHVGIFLLGDAARFYIEIAALRYGLPRLPTLKERIAESIKRKMFQAKVKNFRGIGSDILDALTGLMLGCQAEKQGKTKKALAFYQEAYEAADRAEGARDKVLAAEYSYRLLRSSNREAALVWLQRTLVAADEYGFMPKTVALKEEFAEDIKELHALFPQLKQSADHKASDDLDLATLIQAGADLAEAKDLKALVDKALEIVVKNLSATRAQLWQPGTPWTRLGGEGEISEAFLDEVYRAQEIRVIDDASETELSCQSALCIPMASGGQAVGLLVIENDTLTEAFPRSRLPFLRTLSNQIATAIANALLYAQMEEKVQEKARAMVAIMTHIEQGILTIEASGKIADDYSSALPQILGLTQIAGRDAMEILFGQAELATDVVDQVGATLFSALGEDVLNFEVNAERLISEFSLRSGKIIEVDWVPIVDDFEEVRSIMVTLRDVTQVRASQAAAEASAMELKRIGSLLALSPRQVSDFFDDARARLEASKARVEQSTDPIDWLELNFRDLHTLKGVSRSYQFLDLAAMIHEVEEPYQTARQSADSALLDTAALNVALAELLDLISDYERIEHEVLKRQGTSSLDLAGLRAAAASRDWQAVDAHLAEEQTLDLEGLLAPVIRSLPTLAKDLGRPEPQLIFDLQTTTIDPSWGTTLLGALTHVLRNSVDHGLKTAESGEIHLAVAETPDHVRITIEDAGRGLNLGALEKKLGSSSDEDLAEAIFRSGLSTNENVSDISGRGVGMDAVRAAIEERGGSVMVEFVSATRDAEGYRKHRLVMVLPRGIAIMVA